MFPFLISISTIMELPDVRSIPEGLVISLLTSSVNPRGAGIVRKARIAKQTGINEGEVVSVWKKMEKDGLGKIENVQGEEVFRQEEVQFG